MTGYTPRGLPYPEMHDYLDRTDEALNDLRNNIFAQLGAGPVQGWAGAVTTSGGGHFDIGFNDKLSECYGAHGWASGGGSMQLIFTGATRPGWATMQAITPHTGQPIIGALMYVVVLGWGVAK